MNDPLYVILVNVKEDHMEIGSVIINSRPRSKYLFLMAADAFLIYVLQL